MNPIPQWMWDVWEEGRFVGENRPVCRATISRHVLKGIGREFRTLLFDQTPNQVEIPNIASVQIDRRLNTEAASMSMRIKNAKPLSAYDDLDETHDGSQTGPTRRELGDLGKPGYYTFRRGVAVDADGVNPWAHDDSTWVDLLIPNRVIFTFQGYGTDGAVSPAHDTRLACTGVWLIDRVEYRSNGDINVQARDLAKLLIEQRLYPPIVPLKHYPLEFCADGTVMKELPADPVTVRAHPGGIGLSTSTQMVVGSGNPVYGHYYQDAFDGDISTYWLSEGYQAASGDHIFPWIQGTSGTQGDLLGRSFKRVRFYQKFTSVENGGYVVYVSVYGRPYKEGDNSYSTFDWMGAETIPYVEGSGFDIHANIPYLVKKNTPYTEGWVTIDLPERVQAREVRLTFGKIMKTSFTSVENPYPYKAGVAEIQTIDVYEQPVPVTGNIKDYTEIVKILCAWAGFFWPNGDQDRILYPWTNNEVVGRVWGDFFYSGAYPVDPYCIEPSFWDNKSVMDGINQIREILGFIFMIDSQGGVQWRPPNIWRSGNFVRGTGYVGESSIRTVSEDNVLLDYGVTIDDAALRSDIIVVSSDDPSLHASYSPGFAVNEAEPGAALSDKALLGGQQRIMLVSNYPFGSAGDPVAEAQINKFAYLVSLWIHWSYRKSKFRIPGTPGFEVDDQVRIYERTTSEVYVHYIQGYSSTMDLEQGTWTMDVETHWLGNGPTSQWMVKASDMHPALVAYLKAIGYLDEDVPDSEYDDDWFTYDPPEYTADPIVVPDDFDELFPLPAGLQWPDPTWSSETYPQYGDPTGGGTGPVTTGSVYNCSQGAKFTYWGSPCSGSWSYVSFNGRSVAVDYRSAPAWRRLALMLVAEGWFPTLVGSYNCRRIRRVDGSYSSTWSNHAWALAVDFDWDDLPQGKRAPSGHPSYRVAQVAQNLRTNTGKNVFRWGGVWSGSTVDPMHFEVCCSPSDIASGFAN